MLEHLLIRNIALFEEIGIQFDQGLHVLTGETGAGKSLVVDAVNFLCGARADRDLIRSGCEKAYVEGLFLLEDTSPLLSQLQQMDLSAEDGQLILSREMNTKGRSVCRVNGMAVSLAVYQGLTAQLIDLHGQHEHQSLLHEGNHLRFLDLLGDAAHARLIAECAMAFDAFDTAKKAYQEALQHSRQKSERMDLLQTREKELSAANIQEDEEESLQAERSLLRNADKIISGIKQVNVLLSDSQREETAGSLIRQAQQAFDKMAGFLPELDALKERLDSLAFELEEIGHDLGTIERGIAHDDARLERIEQRLDLLRKLQRKYGPTNQAMLAELAQIQAELSTYESLDQEIDRLASLQDEVEAQYVSKAQQLSLSRQALAARYEQLIEQSLRELNMGGTRFQIAVMTDISLRRPEGIDKVNMLIAPNVGEELKPLSKIASGGELSRVMLAMKAIAAQQNEVPTMVFDEIDTGVSGHTAQVIAQRLWDIGRYRQVICVSHLHQLAAMASSQHLVAKFEEGGRTRAEVRLLLMKDRAPEIATMLGSQGSLSKSSLQHAQVLLDEAAAYRAQHPA